MNGAHWDVIVLGAGAAGLMCALEAGRRGRRVLVLDHGSQPGAKICISGGGHCNLTNRTVSKNHYLSLHPGFCTAALGQFGAEQVVHRLTRAGIAVEERPGGQYFCVGSARQVVTWLLEGCRSAQVEFHLGQSVQRVEQAAAGFAVHTQQAVWQGHSLVVASGGLSFPALGASDLGYRLARQWGLTVVPTRPGLVPLLLPRSGFLTGETLAGLAVEASVHCQKVRFSGPLLFTHRGLSGPVILQISSHWRAGEPVRINLLPGVALESVFRHARACNPRQEVATVLSQHLPRRLTHAILNHLAIAGRMAEIADARLRQLAEAVHRWTVTPTGTEGYRLAEVTTGGVDTAHLASKTMECRTIPGLYFIGEVVDITGQLGGYNLQWAWSSGYAAGQWV
ncbi:MAG: NAD(P)/FAD-dependent oxidoreductase [Magnetococcales bacterium]|nr:NAD(P)/FAD-dependent oxidoreductase [Magnetococcales bacterium]